MHAPLAAPRPAPSWLPRSTHATAGRDRSRDSPRAMCGPHAGAARAGTPLDHTRAGVSRLGHLARTSGGIRSTGASFAQRRQDPSTASSTRGGSLFTSNPGSLFTSAAARLARGARERGGAARSARCGASWPRVARRCVDQAQVGVGGVTSTPQPRPLHGPSTRARSRPGFRPLSSHRRGPRSRRRRPLVSLHAPGS